jgi:succinyl-diaminopimelate desuccinylase
MRIPWGCNIRDLIQDLMIHAPHAVILSSEINEPSMTSPDARIVTRTCDAIMKVAGGQAAPIVQWAASDARHLRAAGFQVAEYGPGELKTLHAIDEHITIESLERSSRVYESVMAEYAR